MLKIILRDDDSFSLHIMADLLKAAIQRGNYQAEAACLASSGKELLGFIQKAPYPYLYFIDFDLGKGELNGIDLGHLILKQDSAAKIIFVTSHTDRGMDILKSGVLKLSNGCCVSYSLSNKKLLLKECFPPSDSH